MQAHEGPTMELEHAIGYLAIDKGLFYHPNARDIVYSAGGTVIVCDLNDPHAQSILIGHDANVTCLALSRGGRLIASGQHGENADAIVWEFEARKELYRLSEHDHGIQTLAFSDDEALLCTAGIPEDGRLLVWDMSTGAIVAIVQQHACPAPVQYMAWGGMVRDVKRRDTRCYQLATAGDKKVRVCLTVYHGAVAYAVLRVLSKCSNCSSHNCSTERCYCSPSRCSIMVFLAISCMYKRGTAH
eukprot:3038-Heterococcus_DN1.PRE.1